MQLEIENKKNIQDKSMKFCPLLKPGTEHGMEWEKKKKKQNGIRNGTWNGTGNGCTYFHRTDTNQFSRNGKSAKIEQIC